MHREKAMGDACLYSILTLRPLVDEEINCDVSFSGFNNYSHLKKLILPQ